MNSVREAYGRLDWWEKAAVQAYAWIAKHLFCQDFNRSFDKMVHRFTQLNSPLNQTAHKTYKAAYDLWDEEEVVSPKRRLRNIVGYEDEIVNLSHFNVQEMPDINGCDQIRVLTASGIRINDLKNFHHLSELTKLDLSGSNIWDLSHIEEFRYLRSLDLSYTLVDTLPEEMTKLNQLEFLFLDGLDLIDFDLLTKLGSLKVLSLTNMDLKEVPEALARLPKDCKVYLWNNPLEQRIENQEEGPIFIYEQGVLSSKLPPKRRVLAGVKLLNLPVLKGVQYLDLSNTEKEDWDIRDFSELKVLHLEQNGFDKVPDKLCKISSLEELYLDNNILETLPKEIGNLQQLRFLSLNDNCLQSLPESIGRLTKLEVLNLKRSLNLLIPEDLLRCTSLKKINLAYSRFDKLPEVLFKLPKTVLVVLKDCELSEEDQQKVHIVNNSFQGPQFFFPVRPVPVDCDGEEDSDHEEMAFSDFDKNISELKLSHYRMMFVPQDLGKYASLRTLDLTGTPIHDISPVYRITQLQALIFVNAWRMTILPQGISNLKFLKVINFNQTYLISIPKEIGELSHLEELHLDKSYLDNFRFVRALKKCKQFVLLSLRENMYESAPEEVFDLPRKCTVRLHQNPLSKLGIEALVRSMNKSKGPHFIWEGCKQEISLTDSNDIRKINLNKNNLSTIPPIILEMTQLEELSLSGNPLETLPDELFNLTRLKVLKLSHTELETLPPKIGQLVHLEALDLSCNFDLILPEEILQCKKLLLLDLSSCGFHALPEFLYRLPDHSFVELLDNPLKALEKAKIRAWNEKRIGPKFLLH